MDATVSTVNGSVPMDELGMTLMHEHLYVDWTRSRGVPPREEAGGLGGGPVDASMAWLLADDPNGVVDNARWTTRSPWHRS